MRKHCSMCFDAVWLRETAYKGKPENERMTTYAKTC